MGFFGKIKKNRNHGSVTLTMLAPAQVEKGQTTVHIQAIITAAGAPQAVNNVTAAIETDSLGNPTDNTVNHVRTAVLAHQDYVTPFQLAAEQSVSLNFDISFDPAAIFGQNSGAPHAVNDRHYVKVSAKVTGAAIDPSARQRIILGEAEQPKSPPPVNGGHA